MPVGLDRHIIEHLDYNSGTGVEHTSCYEVHQRSAFDSYPLPNLSNSGFNAFNTINCLSGLLPTQFLISPMNLITTDYPRAIVRFRFHRFNGFQISMERAVQVLSADSRV